MSDINVNLSRKLTNEEAHAAIEDELQEFDRVFGAAGNSPLSTFEKAILRSYLASKIAKKE